MCVYTYIYIYIYTVQSRDPLTRADPVCWLKSRRTSRHSGVCGTMLGREAVHMSHGHAAMRSGTKRQIGIHF